MCLAAPSRVIEVRDGMAVTECFGVTREVSLLLMNEEVVPGDYVLIQAGGFAFERVEAERAEEALALDQALAHLAEVDPRAAQVMELRYFGGLSVPQVAEVLSVSSRSVERDWQFARAFLHEALRGA